MPSSEAVAIRDRYRQMRSEDDGEFDLATIRQQQVNHHELTGIPEEGIDCRWDVIGGVPSLRVHPARESAGFNTLFIHGGAFCLGSAWSYHRFAAFLAHATGSTVIVPDYCLAPERPYPNGLDECLSVMLAVQHEHESGRTMLVGDSAGGNLAMATMLRLRESSSCMPVAAALLVPWLDLTMSSPDVNVVSDRDLVLNVPDMHIYARLYSAGEPVTNPFLSPLFCALHGLPPIYLQSAEIDILRDDSRRLERKLKSEGLDVSHDLFPEMLHSFHFHVGNLPEANTAFGKIAEFLKSH